MCFLRRVFWGLHARGDHNANDATLFLAVYLFYLTHTAGLPGNGEVTNELLRRSEVPPLFHLYREAHCDILKSTMTSSGNRTAAKNAASKKVSHYSLHYVLRSLSSC